MSIAEQLDELERAGYNDGAARWIVDQIAAGKGTLKNWTFAALNLAQVTKLNAEHATYRGTLPPLTKKAVQTGTATVRTNSEVMLSHVYADGTADLGRGKARIMRFARGNNDRLIIVPQADGSEIRILVMGG